MAFSRNAPKPQSRMEFIEAPNQQYVSSKEQGSDPHTNTSISMGVADNCGQNIAREMLQRTSEASEIPYFAQSSQSNGTRNYTPSWAGFNRKATAKNLFNLRLNDYYLEILRHLAKVDDETSMQKIVKEILLPELERRVAEKAP